MLQAMQLFQQSLQNQKVMNRIIQLLLSVLVLLSCGSKSEPHQKEKTTQEVEKVIELELSLEQISDSVVTAFQQKDIQRLLSYSSKKGVRFSPYATISENNKLIHLYDVNLSELINWGNYDGSGEPISLNFHQYTERFVVDVDYLNPSIAKKSIDKVQGNGNSINNLESFYEGKSFVEYFNDGINPEYQGNDWTALRLVFEKIGEHYLLIGVIHDQWTT